ncbi:hypothetical protein HK103_003850 [Boothiomyces macroporosus]|uniref:Multiple myeloma tumor-associated protein 2-like N-terminal domain-containing protein n=1 Tax=Boothiomyces macroporosus TaxID=261099 RepID=A0AAD5UM70_9FUNG|nr:hypothetical protein HK103_003850 [Boothiomyces macroporosus]
MPRRGKPEVEKIREGNRGGLGLFRWENIKEDKHREIYLGNTVKCAVGRWQKNKNLNWFNEQKVTGESQVELDEIAEIKRKETEAMMEALGLKKAEDTVINQQDMAKIVKNELPEQVVDEKIVVGAKRHKRTEERKRERSRSRERRKDRSRSRERRRGRSGSRERKSGRSSDRSMKGHSSNDYSAERKYRAERRPDQSPDNRRERDVSRERSRSPRRDRSSERKYRDYSPSRKHDRSKRYREYSPNERDRKRY